MSNEFRLYKEQWNWSQAKEYIKSNDRLNDEALIDYIFFLKCIGEFKLIHYVLEKYNEEVQDKYLQDDNMYISIGTMNDKILNFSLELNDIDYYIQLCFDFIKDENYLSASYVVSNLIDYFGFNLKNMKYHMKFLEILNILKCSEFKTGANIYIYKLYYLLKPTSNKCNFKINIAVCLWGCVRGRFAEGLGKIYKNIVNPLGADVFIHTWSDFYLWPGYGGDSNFPRRYFQYENYVNFPEEFHNFEIIKQKFPNVYDKINKPIITSLRKKYILDNFNVNDLEIEEFSNFGCDNNKDSDFLKEKLESHYADFAVPKMRYQMFKVVDNLKMYEKKHNIRYDYILMCRLDTPVEETVNLEHLLELNFNEMGVGLYGCRVDNRYLYGTRDVIFKFVDKWIFTLKNKKVDFYNIKEKYGYYGEEIFEYYWMMDNFISIKPVYNYVNFLTNVTGICPYFYKELLVDLNCSAIEFKHNDRYLKFLEFIKNNKNNLFIGDYNVHNFLKYKYLMFNSLEYTLGNYIISEYRGLLSLFKIIPTVTFMCLRYKFKGRLLNTLEPKHTNHLSYKIGVEVITYMKKWYRFDFLKLLKYKK